MACPRVTPGYAAIVAVFIAAIGVAVAAATPLQAQDRLDTIQSGTTAARVQSKSNPVEQYAVFLPSAYDTVKRWPLVILMDPRGGAMRPLAAMRPMAERLGYSLISSYNTVSDSTTEPNVVALNTILRDAGRELRVDPKRLYIAGFSGTARMAWTFARDLSPHVAGILGAGASGLSFREDAAQRGAPPTAFYGTVGTHDSNYEEMQSFEPWLVSTNLSYRLREFEGPHDWPPDSLMEDALVWFELKAMQRGLRAVDTAFVRDRFAADTLRARGFEEKRDWIEASRAWSEIARDYEHIADTRRADAHAVELAASANVKKAYDHQFDMIRRRSEFEKREAQVYESFEASAVPQKSAARLYDDLGLAGIRKAAEKAKDPRDAEAERRKLRRALSNAASYHPRAMIGANKPLHALVYLDLAELISPGSTRNNPMRAMAEKMR
jgi:predicted esterase